MATPKRSFQLDGVFSRKEAVAEFRDRHQAGEHVTFFGPTGRGKTTWARALLERPATPNALILSVKGKDPALEGLGKPVKTWPPDRRNNIVHWFKPKEDDGKPKIYRWEPIYKSRKELVQASSLVGGSLSWLWARRAPDNWTLFLPDLQVISDPGLMGLGKWVEGLLLTARAAGNSIWLDAQAPRWIPRAASDQISHLFIFANRDIDTIRRLREIAGLDMQMVQAVMEQMAFHEVLWIDVKRDEYFLVEEK